MQVTSILKKALKTFFWIVLIFAFTFLLLAGFIQIPAIQTRIVQYATSLISNKTHTKAEIRKVRISFPKSVVLEGLYLEDQHADTLIYAGKAKINMAFWGLFRNKIHISSFALDDASIKLYSSETDSRFNYNFLLTAFSDTTGQTQPAPETASPWTFSLGHVDLKKIRFRYDDVYGGMHVTAVLEQAKLKMERIDPEKSVYQIGDLLIDKLTADVWMQKTGNQTEATSPGTLPEITAAHFRISQSIVNYTDSVGQQAVAARIDQLKGEAAEINLGSQLIGFDQLFMSKSELSYRNFGTEEPAANAISDAAPQNNWKVVVKNIDLEDNSVAYHAVNQPELKNLFDVNHLTYDHLNLKANNLNYAPDLTAVTVTQFSAVDRNNFAITALEADFRMDQHSVSARKLKARTAGSSVDADFSIRYASIASLVDSLQFSDLNLDLRAASVNTADILYFSPGLGQQPFFKNTSNTTFASGKINGPVNQLTGKNLVLKTGANTVAETDFSISGLPDFRTAVYSFPNLNIRSGRKDITAMAGAYIPETIELPETILVQLGFHGRMKAFESTANLTSSFGAAHLEARISPDEKFSGTLSIDRFNLGQLLKDSLTYGPVSLTAEANGRGLDPQNINATVKADVSELYLKNYTYHGLKLDGSADGREFTARLSLKDENAVFDLDGKVNWNPGKEQYKFRLNVAGVDLQKLRLTDRDLLVGLVASADFKGRLPDGLTGRAAVSDVVIAHQGQKYRLNSAVLTSVSEPGKSELNLSSALADAKYAGTVFPLSLPAELTGFLNTYFQFSDSVPVFPNDRPSAFNFEVQLHNHPILSEVLVPELKEFEPGMIRGSFDSRTSSLKLNAAMNKVVYAGTEIRDFVVDVSSDAKALNYTVSSKRIANSQVSLDNFLIEGKLAGQKLFASLSSIDDKKRKKLQVSTQIIRDGANYKLTLDPDEFYIMDKHWSLAADHYIAFGKQGFLIHNLSLSNAESQISMASVHNQFNDDLNIGIRNFKLDDLSAIVEKDSSLIKGIVDGNVLLKRVNNAYGLIADAKIANLFVRNVPLGDLTVKAENASTERFNVAVKLSGTENNLEANGYFIPDSTENSFHFNTVIQALSLKTVQAFSMGTITRASGNLSGHVGIEGNASAPELTGELVFSNASVTPAVLNNPLELKHETIQLRKDGVYFDSFTILDKHQHPATINGMVKMNRFSDFVFALKVDTKEFLLFNTTAKDNKEFFGRMIIDSRIDITGPLSLPVVNAALKLKDGSNFTFSVPEERLTTDKGEDVVEFETGAKLNPILSRDEQTDVRKSNLTGFDVSSVIEIDKQATLRLLMDPTSSDSLVVKGEAALSFTIDRSGKMSLTGAYNLNEGSYMVSLESVIKRRFEIERGSTMVWNGDPYNAEIAINASYSVRTSPIDLMAGQLSGLSEADHSGYKQRYRFLVFLKLRGELLHPEISFEIQLPPEDKGILNGAVNQKLILLNEDESALNKQVFALLVLGRFIQENPLQTESGSTSTLVRATVGKYLSQQLNQWSNKVLPGVDLNFDVQSYNDFQTGKAQGRTQVDIGLKKQLFNERLSVELGGSLDVEGEKVRQNSASDITSDVTVEYKLTKDGRYRLKGFRHNQYEGVIEGQLVETGVGVLYVRDFNKWNEFLKAQKDKNEKQKKKKKDETISPK